MEHSLNDLQLNNTLLAALYGHSLIEFDEKIRPSERPKEIPIRQTVKFLGNNTKKITILVNNPEFAFLPEDQLSFLTKMLAACQLNTGDVAIVNIAHENPGTAALIAELYPVKIISFMKTGDAASFNMDTTGGIKYLDAPELACFISDTEVSKQLKTKLWAALKEMFNLG